MQELLGAPGSALVGETESESPPGMTDQVMDSTKPVESATESTVEQWVKMRSTSRR
jgi:hypothetical protein